MLSRWAFLWMMVGFLAIATPVASDLLLANTKTVTEVAQWMPPPPECGLYDCKSPGR